MYSAVSVCVLEKDNMFEYVSACVSYMSMFVTAYESLFAVLSINIHSHGCVTNFISKGHICYTKILPKSKGIKPLGSFSQCCT